MLSKSLFFVIGHSLPSTTDIMELLITVFHMVVHILVL